MITQTSMIGGRDSWQSELKKSFLSLDEFFNEVEINEEQMVGHVLRESSFNFRVTKQYASRIKKGDLNDPLLLQVLPTVFEEMSNSSYSIDPVGEALLLETKTKVLKKYKGRGLIIVTGACAINCRYCFRKSFPYNEKVGQGALATAITEIAEDSSISEVILSGGDPLFVDDSQLSTIFLQLAHIKHVKRVRIHTRLPIVFPERISKQFLSMFFNLPYSICIVMHSNHANELDDQVLEKLSDCQKAGITILNQTVLLKNINDSALILAALSERLFEGGALPYYVHLLDKVSGAEHFDIPLEKALEIEAELRNIVSGYLMPKFVKEVPGKASKTPIWALQL
jgi:L-lysine 2,3-aminomutase